MIMYYLIIQDKDKVVLHTEKGTVNNAEKLFNRILSYIKNYGTEKDVGMYESKGRYMIDYLTEELEKARIRGKSHAVLVLPHTSIITKITFISF